MILIRFRPRTRVHQDTKAVGGGEGGGGLWHFLYEQHASKCNWISIALKSQWARSMPKSASISKYHYWQMPLIMIHKSSTRTNSSSSTKIIGGSMMQKRFPVSFYHWYFTNILNIKMSVLVRHVGRRTHARTHVLFPRLPETCVSRTHIQYVITITGEHSNQDQICLAKIV